LRGSAVKSFDQDTIHDLRVASRRFRAALELFYPFAPSGTTATLRKKIRTMTRMLGRVRNIDEAHLFFQARLENNAPVSSTLFESLSTLRSTELKRIRKFLVAFDHHSLDRLVRETVAAINEEKIASQNRFSLLAYFSDVSIRLYLPIHKQMPDSLVSAHSSVRHSLRIAIKKWRYFFEIVAQVLDRDYGDILGQLKAYQGILGQMNDKAEFKVLLRDVKLSRSEQEKLYELLAAEDARLIAEYVTHVELKPLGYTFLV